MALHTGSPNTPDSRGNRSCRALVLLLFGIIVASFVAFLVLRPNQQARPSPASPPTSH